MALIERGNSDLGKELYILPTKKPVYRRPNSFLKRKEAYNSFLPYCSQTKRNHKQLFEQKRRTQIPGSSSKASYETLVPASSSKSQFDEESSEFQSSIIDTYKNSCAYGTQCMVKKAHNNETYDFDRNLKKEPEMASVIIPKREQGTMATDSSKTSWDSKRDLKQQPGAALNWRFRMRKFASLAAENNQSPRFEKIVTPSNAVPSCYHKRSASTMPKNPQSSKLLTAKKMTHNPLLLRIHARFSHLNMLLKKP